MKKRWLRKKATSIGRPLNNQQVQLVRQSFFEEDISQLVDFQNANRQWQSNGGIPKFLCDNIK
jgi:hypothetical protein